MRVFAAILSILLTDAILRGGEPAPRQVRILGPDKLQRGMRNRVVVEGLFEGNAWKPLGPDGFSVKATGPARIAEDPAGKPMNPFELLADDVAKGSVTVEIRAGSKVLTRAFEVG